MRKSYLLHPSPMLRRRKVFSLNGEWTISAQGKSSKIRVPYPPESDLSGYCGELSEQWTYECEFVAPVVSEQETLILHFGAVDQIARVFIDENPAKLHCLGNFAASENEVGAYVHFGGYLPFEIENAEQYFDTENTDKHVIRVEVTDTLSHVYPYGKQRKKRGGMWYTPISGIWKDVWLEVVPKDTPAIERIRDLKITPDLCGVRIERYLKNGDSFGFDVTIPELGIREHTDESSIYIHIPNGEYWTPENPKLYDITISNHIDEVSSYFALRTVSVGEVNGVQRLLLNGKPYFFHGVLDQGYFADGIYTPKSPEAYEKDILAMKKLGFNTLRKHIKIEPESFYEACDRLGMIVFQDMVNNGDYSFLRDTALPTIGLKRLNDKILHVNKASRAAYLSAMHETINLLYNHPCVCYYTLFNEGWGQFCGDSVYTQAKAIDPTRIFDSTSGWFAQKKSDVDSLHVYFRPVKISRFERPVSLSEFGGYSLRIPGHLFSEKNYGYRDMNSKDELSAALYKLYTEEVIPYIKSGLCVAIYTQLSDVEDETNGLLTYDREVVKVDETIMLEIMRKIKTETEKLSEK